MQNNRLYINLYFYSLFFRLLILFCSGVAVRITETASGCPILGNHCLPPGAALLQNLPSVACVRALNPKPGDTVLDMCASPGNKTTHIAALMNNEVRGKRAIKINCLLCMHIISHWNY